MIALLYALLILLLGAGYLLARIGSWIVSLHLNRLSARRDRLAASDGVVVEGEDIKALSTAALEPAYRLSLLIFHSIPKATKLLERFTGWSTGFHAKVEWVLSLRKTGWTYVTGFADALSILAFFGGGQARKALVVARYALEIFAK